MSKGDLVEMDGHITDAQGGGWYKVKIDDSGAEIRARLSGKMKQAKIRVLSGDGVRVGLSPYDLSHGIIVYRGRGGKK